MPQTSSHLSVSELSTEEIETVSRYLTGTATAVKNVVTGLTGPQWRFKPAPDRWSIAEVLEHVVIVEGRVQSVVRSMPEAPEPPAGWNHALIDQTIAIDIPDHSLRYTAPDVVCPSGQLSGPELLQGFLDARHQTMQLLTAPALRGRVLPHPIRGLWDGYHWLLAAAAHSARHTSQILELKAHPHFPQGD